MEEFVNIPHIKDEKNFSIHCAGISYCDKNYSILRRSSDVLCIEYILSGTGTVKTQGKTFYPQGGDTYMLIPDEYHEYFADPDDPWIKIWFNASGNIITPLIDAYKLRNRTVFHCNSQKYIEKMHRMLENEVLSPREKVDKSAVIFHEILQLLKNSITEKTNLSPEAETIKNYIDTHIYSKINIDEISELINKSPAQTIRIFKKSFNKTPYDYHLENKLNKAVVFLENTGLSVKEIAYRLGFCDEHYFSGLVKTKTGKSPTEYRK